MILERENRILDKAKSKCKLPEEGLPQCVLEWRVKALRGKWEQCQRQTMSSLLLPRSNLHVYEILTTEWQQVTVQEEIKTNKKR